MNTSVANRFVNATTVAALAISSVNFTSEEARIPRLSNSASSIASPTPSLLAVSGVEL